MGGKGVVSQLAAETADIVRRAYEAGLREGQASVEAQRARAYQDGVRDGRAASQREHAAALTKAVALARAETGAEAPASGRRGRKKEWGTIRPAIYAAIAGAPGRTAQEVEAATGAKVVTVRNALADFVAEGYATKDGDGRFLAVDFDRNMEALRPKPRALKVAILGFLAGNPGATTATVIARMGHKSTSVRATLYALRDAGEVAGSADGWSVPSP